MNKEIVGWGCSDLDDYEPYMNLYDGEYEQQTEIIQTIQEMLMREIPKNVIPQFFVRLKVEKNKITIERLAWNVLTKI